MRLRRAQRALAPSLSLPRDLTQTRHSGSRSPGCAGTRASRCASRGRIAGAALNVCTSNGRGAPQTVRCQLWARRRSGGRRLLPARETRARASGQPEITCDVVGALVIDQEPQRRLSGPCRSGGVGLAATLAGAATVEPVRRPEPARAAGPTATMLTHEHAPGRCAAPARAGAPTCARAGDERRGSPYVGGGRCKARPERPGSSDTWRSARARASASPELLQPAT